MLLVTCAAIAVLGSIPDGVVGLAASPDVLWSTNPVLPNQTAVVVFSGTAIAGTNNVTVEMCRWGATGDACDNGSPSQPVPVVAGDGVSTVMFRAPEQWTLGAWSFRLCTESSLNSSVSSPTTTIADITDGSRDELAPASLECGGWQWLNRADPWWAQGDLGATVTVGPSGWLRVFGRALAFDAAGCVNSFADAKPTTASVRLVPTASSGAPVLLTTSAAGSCFDLAASVPLDTPLGSYVVEVNNGLSGNEAGWVATSDGQPIVVALPNNPASSVFHPDGFTGGDIAAALHAAGSAGGGTVALKPGQVYLMDAADTLYVPDGVTLTTDVAAQSSQTQTTGKVTPSSARAILEWRLASPRLPNAWPSAMFDGWPAKGWGCRGPGQEINIWHNRSARLANCPPLMWGNGTFAIVNIHARAPAMTAMVELVEPSWGATIADSVLEVTGIDPDPHETHYINVSNVLRIGNCSGFTIRGNTLAHIAAGAVEYGGQYAVPALLDNREVY